MTLAMEVLLLQQDCIFTIISDVNVFSKREKMSLNRKRAGRTPYGPFCVA